jgi:hypothetical protein
VKEQMKNHGKYGVPSCDDYEKACKWDHVAHCHKVRFGSRAINGERAKQTICIVG